ncbi:MAG: PrsW family intramembrane metalloprotease [Caldilineales bacterium]|nr:PrsW family intramembrane metalloprotease [Caldilineales bacterium]
MKCPHCGHEPTPADARFCPNCGQPVQTPARTNITQRVETNLGQVIGVRTDAIHGDVYGGDIYEVQVYALSDAGRAGGWQRFVDERTPPYKFLAPYEARDRAIFKGRDEDSGRVLRRVGEQIVTVLYGPPASGKTSLLAAGVIPDLLDAGALVLHLRDYAQPDAAIRNGLRASAANFDLAVPEGGTLSDQIRGIIDQIEGSFILVLDQCERLFEPTIRAEIRQGFVQSLARVSEQVESGYFRLLLSIREESLGRLLELEEMLPGLRGQNGIRLRPLTREQAGIAIEEPLRQTNSRVSFVRGVVDSLLIPDLDSLTREAGDSIEPFQLQVVCNWLYQAAADEYPHHIDDSLYKRGRRAQGIMARYLQDVLEIGSAQETTAARRALEIMAVPGMRNWIDPAQLSLNGATPPDLPRVLDDLVDRRLLLARSVNAHREYRFAGEIVREEVRRLSSGEGKQAQLAGGELNRIWETWLARRVLPSAGHLAYLDAVGIQTPVSPEQAILVIRASAHHHDHMGMGLGWLRNDSGRRLIGQLEDPNLVPANERFDEAYLEEPADILGLTDVTPPDPSDEGRSYGHIARTAVLHPDPGQAVASAVALAALGARPALDRLRWAWLEELSGRAQRRRRVALQGALAEADAEAAEIIAKTSGGDRFGIWLWRLRERFIRNQVRVAGLMAGGAVGAGLGLGLLRFITAILTSVGKTPGTHLAMNLLWGILLGAMVALGLALSEIVVVGHSGETASATARRRARMGIVLGTAGFAIAYVLIILLIGRALFAAPLVVILGIAAGLGLNLALYRQPGAGWRMGWGQWAWRLAVAALTFLLTSAVFLAMNNEEGSISIVWSSGEYLANLILGLRRPLANVPNWHIILGLLDAVMVGVVLTVGITGGMRLATRWLERWRKLVARAGG